MEVKKDIKKVLLSPTTTEFAHIEYGLQLALRSSTARILSAHAVSNPHLSIQFEKRCKVSQINPPLNRMDSHLSQKH